MSIVVKKVVEKLDSRKVIVEADHNNNILHAFLVDDIDVETYLNISNGSLYGINELEALLREFSD